QVWAHELGHDFSLCHTHGCDSDCAGDDGIADTITDCSNWDEDQIAQHNFNLFYYQLTASQRNAVDNVLYNIMSYHGTGGCTPDSPLDRLTEGQLDRWGDSINDHYLGNTTHGGMSGIVLFMDPNGRSYGIGSSFQPTSSLANAASLIASRGGTRSIVSLRPGS